MKKKISYKVIFLILISSVFLGFIYNLFSVDGIKFIREKKIIRIIEEIEFDSLLTDSTIKGIKTKKAIEIYTSGSAVFIDARDQWEFSEGHINGALNIPEFSFEPNNKLLASFEKEQLFIIYCDGDDCDISTRLAYQFQKLGYKNSIVYIDGFSEWQKLNYPISKAD